MKRFKELKSWTLSTTKKKINKFFLKEILLEKDTNTGHVSHDQYARGVVVCCEGAVSYLACLLAGLFIYLLACLLTSFLVGWLIDWLLGWLAHWLVGWLVGCLLALLVGLLAHLLACSFACFLACFFGLLCLLILICFAWLTCEARAVEHQKLNQTKPYGVVWLSFWCSTYLPLFALSWLGFRFSLVCLLILLWFGLLV